MNLLITHKDGSTQEVKGVTSSVRNMDEGMVTLYGLEGAILATVACGDIADITIKEGRV